MSDHVRVKGTRRVKVEGKDFRHCQGEGLRCRTLSGPRITVSGIVMVTGQISGPDVFNRVS